MAGWILRRCTYANVCATIALFVCLGGVSWAAARLPANSVSSSTVRNSSLTGVDVKNNSLSGADAKDNSIESRDVRNGTLIGNDVADDALTGADVRDLTGADIDESTLAPLPVVGHDRFGPQRLTAAGAADEATARAGAPEVTLLQEGSLSITARCFRDEGADVVHGEVYVRTTLGGVVADSPSLTTLGGGPIASDFLQPGTLPADRRIQRVNATNDDAAFANGASGEVAALSPDGAYLRGLTYVGVRNGALAHPQVFGAAEHGCVFGGFAASS